MLTVLVVLDVLRKPLPPYLPHTLFCRNLQPDGRVSTQLLPERTGVIDEHCGLVSDPERLLRRGPPAVPQHGRVRLHAPAFQPPQSAG